MSQAGIINISGSGTGVVQTLTGNTGGAIHPTAGNINTLGTGSITIAGSGSTLTTQLTGLTNHNVLLGAGTATITNLAPSSTSGVPLISQGASADPAFGTAAIAGGGTNATSFTQTNGIVTYNGTSLVNYAGPQINSSGQQTNTAQPAFMAFLSSPTSNSTGDGTAFTIVFDTANFNIGTMYGTGTGTVTIPVAGRYWIHAQCLITSVGAGHTYGNIQVNSLSGTYSTSSILHGGEVNPATCRALSVDTNDLIMTVQGFVQFAANDTFNCQVTVSSSTKTIGVFGGASPNFYTHFEAFLVC